MVASVNSSGAVEDRFLAETKLPLCRLEVKKHFDSLTRSEKLYAHYISRAGWAGSYILANTMSPESGALVELILEVFTDHMITSIPKRMIDIEKSKPSTVSEESWNYFVEYSVQVLNNLGNYKSFGDVKFIPRLPQSDFDKIIQSFDHSKIRELYGKVKDDIYAATPNARLLLGYPADGHVSGYYSQNISKEDVEFVQRFLEENNISALNTRLFKDNAGKYEVKIACSNTNKASQTHQYNGKTIIVKYGDFSKEMTLAASYIEKAVQYSGNENQRSMLKAYVDSFRTGSIEAHKESQRYWIRDVGPTVETNIGFIETYRDPAGVRAEWEGFVAVVNKEMTEKFGHLVDAAPTFIELLPWGKDFEKDKFNRPDFTSLEVVNFATSGSPPAGINIPNYDDIRQTEGFKNVSLGNIVSAKASNEKITFLKPEDITLYEKLRGEAFELQVGLHELLGHGSGKLLSEVSPGKHNFDISNPPISPVTNKPITTWYKAGETWGSVFKSVAASYEECRAEAVALFLAVNERVLNIFGYHNQQEMEDVVYICYLNMARAGLLALEFYDPSSKKWGQAHVQARFALLQVMIKAGIVRIVETGEDGLEIHLDRSQIQAKGVPAVGDFLCKLNVYKATADAVTGTQFYVDATTVPDSWLSYRDIVLTKIQPRKVFVQGNTFIRGDEIILKEYDLSYAGFIQSFIEKNLG